MSLWHPDRGLESLPAAEYVRMLEEEVRVLRQQLTNQGGGFGGATVSLGLAHTCSNDIQAFWNRITPKILVA